MVGPTHSDGTSTNATIAGMEEMAHLFVSDDRKLALWFEFCVLVAASDVSKGIRVHQHMWMDKAGEGEAEQDCPTPTPLTNNSLESKAALHRSPMWFFDVVSALPHAEEERVNVYMRAPKGWINQAWERRAGIVWRLVKSLYGRRTAGANFWGS